MKELKCPRCGNVFTVDEADYASIVNQVKNQEFNREVSRRLEELHKQTLAEQTAQALKAEQKFQNELASSKLALSEKNSEIAKLSEKLNGIAQSKQLEFGVEIQRKENEITGLKSAIEKNDATQRIAILEEQGKAQQVLQSKENAIADLKSQINSQKS